MFPQKRILLLGLASLFLNVVTTCSSAGALSRQAPADADMNQQLLEAAWKGDKAAVESLLARGADRNAKNKNGSTALILAARGGHADVVDVLLAAKADVNLKENEGGTALIAAALALEGHPEVVERLLRAGADPNATDVTGLTALMGAAISGDLKKAEALLAAKVDVNAKTNKGETALISAAIGGYEPLVERLLAAGADPNAKASSCEAPGKTSLSKGKQGTEVRFYLATIKGCTALKLAKRGGYLSIVEMLKKAGAKE